MDKHWSDRYTEYDCNDCGRTKLSYGEVHDTMDDYGNDNLCCPYCGSTNITAEAKSDRKEVLKMNFNDMVRKQRNKINKSEDIITIGRYVFEKLSHPDDDEEWYTHEFAEGDEIRVLPTDDGRWYVEVYIDYELKDEFDTDSLGSHDFGEAIYCIRDRITYDVMINQLGETLNINGFTFHSLKGEGYDYGCGPYETCYYYSEGGGRNYYHKDRFIVIFLSLSDDDKSIDGISDINFYNADCKGPMIGDHWGPYSLSEFESKVIEGMHKFEFVEDDYNEPEGKSDSERISEMTSKYGSTITLGNLVFTPMSTGDMSGYIGYECVLRGSYITLFPPKVNEVGIDEWEIYVDDEATTLGPTLKVEDVRRFIIEQIPDEVEHLEEDWGDGWDSLWESRRKSVRKNKLCKSELGDKAIDKLTYDLMISELGVLFHLGTRTFKAYRSNYPGGGDCSCFYWTSDGYYDGAGCMAERGIVVSFDLNDACDGFDGFTVEVWTESDGTYYSFGYDGADGVKSELREIIKSWL